MEAMVLVKKGDAKKAFERRTMPDPAVGPGAVKIGVEAFGLNYADVMARHGIYRDAPPMPSVIGYEVVGRVLELGSGVDHVSPGQRVVAMTRFGGYATEAVTQAEAVVPIPDSMSNGAAVALAVQYSTAWYCAEEMVRLHPGDHVLVQAAAGGVGTALVQMAKRHGCHVYGTAGSEKKMDYLKALGVDVPINYRKEDFFAVIKKERGDSGLDVVFDSVGGKTFKQATKLLGPGGRIVGFGAASRSSGMKNIIGDIRTLLGFGFYSPPFMLMGSKGIIGVSMLKIADHRPDTLKRCLDAVAELTAQGELEPKVGGVFKADQLAEAHTFLESRKSTGKIVVEW